MTVLYCVYKNHVDYLITEDKDIHLKSKLLKIADQILTVEKAIDLLDTDQTFGSTKRSTSRHPNPEYSFYKNGDFWLIGEKGNERQLKDLKGFRFISFLLQYPNQYFSPSEVFGEGKDQNVDTANNRDGLKITGDILKLRNKGSHISKAKIKSIAKSIETKIEENDYDDSDDLTKAKKQLKILNEYLRPRGQRDYKSESEKARVNVIRRIKLALERIYHMAPELALYLNDSTIKSGDSFSYSPILGQEPTWILTPKDPKRIPT